MARPAFKAIAVHALAALCWLLPPGALAGADACPADRAFKAEAAQEPVPDGPYGKGTLWEVKARGAPASYLFGTIHVQITRLPPAVALAIVKASSFVAETVLDQAAMDYYQQHMLSETAPNVDSLFEQPFRKRLLAVLAEYGFDRPTALGLRPWAAFTLLSRPRPTGAPTLDQMLEGMARQRGIPVHGLQPIEELVAALEDIPLDHQREIVIDTVCNRALIERQAQELTDRYLDQDLTGMLAVSSRYESSNEAVARTFRERLLDDRNRQMLKRLQPYLKKGNAFIAVGALHLPGEEGLLQGLEARGYRVTAVH
jgi:uncharacterized protein YbaP (TraB family)